MAEIRPSCDMLSLAGLRVWPALAAWATVVVGGLTAREFGGGRRAQLLAAAGVATMPVLLGSDHLANTTGYELLAWAGLALVVARIGRTGDCRWWLAGGVVAGLGVTDDHSMSFFAVALVIGALLSGGPMSFYKPDPDLRVAKWLRAIWRGRGKVEPDAWRLYFVVMADGQPVGEQTLTGVNFSALGTVTTFSWLSADERGRGLGHEMRAAILHLAFDGLGAKEAASDAFADNHGSNAISQGLGYQPNGSDWATRQGEPALLNRWRLTKDNWERRRRSDIQLHNVEACHALLPLS